MRSQSNPAVTIKVTNIIRESEKAITFLIKNQKISIPRSIIQNWNTEKATIECWFLDKKSIKY